MTSALNLAKSQLENVGAQTYNTSIGNGNLSNTYGLITANGGNIMDKTNYNISGLVENVPGSASLQKITVNVSYMNGKRIQLIGYKDAGESVININAPYRNLFVTDNIQNMPELYSGSFCPSSDTHCDHCAPVFTGFYHVFNTSGGQASITWNFDWVRWDDGTGESGVNPSMGAPMIAIYKNIPSWANRDYLGVAKTDGLVQRQQDKMGVLAIGALPGTGNLSDGGDSACQCYCNDNCSNESAPVWLVPYDFGYYAPIKIKNYNSYFPCSGASLSGDKYWYYDEPLGSCSDVIVCALSGTLDRTFTTQSLSPGTYTILFFNGENKINIETTTAAIAYPK